MIREFDLGDPVVTAAGRTGTVVSVRLAAQAEDFVYGVSFDNGEICHYPPRELQYAGDDH